MVSVGLFEAKTHLSALLRRVKRGEKITITTHGVPTAMLVPVTDTPIKPSHAEIGEGFRQLRKRLKGRRINVRSLSAEGRRF